jgi:hypothetical protein
MAAALDNGSALDDGAAFEIAGEHRNREVLPYRPSLARGDWLYDGLCAQPLYAQAHGLARGLRQRRLLGR